MGKGSQNRTKKKRNKRQNVSLAALPANVTAKPSSTWDMGPDTAAQRAGKVVEEAEWIDEETGEKVNPNGVKRARRIDLIESYHTRDSPILSKRQFNAACALRAAYEATKRSPPAIKEIQVDASPKPDQHVDILIDRISRYSAIMSHVPGDCRDVVDAVVLENQSIGWLKQYRNSSHPKGVRRLQRGLDAVAARLKL